MTRMIEPPELERLVKQHIADLWSEPAAEVLASSELLASFGLDVDAVTLIAAQHVSGPVPAGIPPLTIKASNFMSGLLLGLWIARELETESLRVEADHFREAALQYGRLLQAVIGREGGELILDRADILNDTTIVVPRDEGDKIIVTLEPFDAG